MATLLAADHNIALSHLVQHILIAHLRLHDRDASRLHSLREAKIAHDGRYNRAVAQ